MDLRRMMDKVRDYAYDKAEERVENMEDFAHEKMSDQQILYSLKKSDLNYTARRILEREAEKRGLRY